MKTFLLGAIVLLALQPTVAQGQQGDSCHYVQVTDSCMHRLWIYQKQNNESAPTLERTMNLGGYGQPSGVALSTTPDWDYSFVAHVKALHVVQFTRDNYPVRSTHYIDELTGIIGFQVQKIAAARPVMTYPVNGSPKPQFALYVVGHAFSGGAWHPYLVVMDQEALIAGQTSPTKLVMGTVELCDEPGCTGKAMDIAVSGPEVEQPEYAPDADTQFAYASVLFDEPGGGARQAFVRITRFYRPRGAWFASVDPIDVDPVLWDGSASRVGGVDFENDGVHAYGVFQSSWLYAKLGGGPACFIGEDHPLDVRMHGPTGLLTDMIGFVSYNYNAGLDGKLVAIPSGTCPGETGFQGDEVDVLEEPTAVGVGAVTPDADVSVYTINRLQHKLQSVDAAISYPLGATKVDFGDVVTTTIMYDTLHNGYGCPTALAVSVEGLCNLSGDPTGIDPNCIGNKDPLCPPPPPPPKGP